MGTWSIDPSGTLASIDNTGKLTYQEHTEDKTYTIKYVGDDGCTDTKQITIKKCEEPTPPSTSKIKLYIANDYNEQGIEIVSFKFSANDKNYTAVADQSGLSATIAGCECDTLETTFTVTPALPENPTIGRMMGITFKADVSEVTERVEIKGYDEGNPPTIKVTVGKNGCLPPPCQM